MPKKGEPLRVRLDDELRALLNEMMLRTSLDGSVIGRAAIRLLYAEVRKRGSTGFILDELSDAQFDAFLKEISSPLDSARLNESPAQKRVK